MNPLMKIAKNMAENGMQHNEGGPFGAVIADKEGNIIAQANNRVLIDHDPTAHAEITAIRLACQKLKTYNLQDYILYTSCEPCPMCLSAIIWANISKVYFGCTKKDAADIGFRDDMIYEYFSGKHTSILELVPMDREDCLTTFKQYQEENKKIY